MLEVFENFLESLAHWSMTCFELVGIIVLIIAGIRGVKDYIIQNPNLRLILAQGMATSLEFKLGSEIIRTVVVREINELYFIGGLIILRASLTLLIHWEIKQEEKKENLPEEKQNKIKESVNSKFISKKKEE